MDITSISTAAQATALNKAGIGQDILSRTLAKIDENDQRRPPKEPKPPEPTDTSRQGRIDIYA